MTKKLTRDEVLNKIDTVLDLDNDELIASGCDELLLQLMPENSSLNSDERAFLTGYILYVHPGLKSAEGSRRAARDHLLSAYAITSDPSISARSALYLGHLLYDAGDFSEARPWFQKARSGELPDYLKLKAMEMTVCCVIQTQGLRAGLPDVREFVDCAETMAMEDVWPRELARVLKSATRESAGGAEAQLLRELASRLDTAGNFGRWFTEIVEIREID